MRYAGAGKEQLALMELFSCNVKLLFNGRWKLNWRAKKDGGAIEKVLFHSNRILEEIRNKIIRA
ncbi:MAG: hypothetical protein R2778_13705 [Saprospiraceae bacterium]